MSDPAAQHILIADDHGLIREGVMRVIRKRVAGATFEQAVTAVEAEQAVAGRQFDLVVLDLGLPGGGELDTLRHMKALRPHLPVLVFTSFTEEKMGRAALRAGADGFLPKSADRASIALAVSETLAGRGYVSENLKRLLGSRASVDGIGAAGLSPRELEVLVELSRGAGQKEIAARLGISVPSVATYRARIMEKLQVSTTAALLRYAIEHRLVRG